MDENVINIEETHFLKDSGTLVSFYNDGTSKRIPNYKKNHTSQGYNDSLTSNYKEQYNTLNKGYLEWGADNHFPEKLMALNSRNPVSDGLIKTKRDFAVGKKIVTYTEDVVDGEIIPNYVQVPEIEDWLEENEIMGTLHKWAYDYMLLGNYFLEAIRNRARNKIVRLEHLDPTLIRVGVTQNGNALDYVFADWASHHRIEKRIPAFNRRTPYKYSKSLIHGRAYMPGSYYYGLPDFIGAENFIRLLNEIPVWHLSGIRNGYGLRWHIKIPSGYFDSYGTKEEIKKAKTEFRDNMDKFLSRAENNGKALITDYIVDHMGKPKNQILIEPLKPELHDKAFTALFEQGMIAVCSAHAINPTLAGVIVNGQLSSGSELRNAYNVYLQLKVPSFREVLLRPLYYVKKANGWQKNIKFGIVGHQVTKLDENAEGGEDVIQ